MSVRPARMTVETVEALHDKNPLYRDAKASGLDEDRETYEKVRDYA